MRATAFSTFVLVSLLMFATPAWAQQADPRLSEERRPVGWSATPRVTTGSAYDDNVLIQGKGDDLQSDMNTSVTPAGSIDYIGKRASFDASYSGSVQLYRDFSSLNSYDQSENVSGRRQVRPHLLLFAQQSFSKTPSTELPALSGIPFARVGARIADVRGGLEATPKKHLSIATSYNFQWIDFDHEPQLGAALLGGHSNGGAFGAKYQISQRTMLTADYDLQLAHLLDGNRFTVQNWWAGGEYQLTENSHVYGALGISRMYAVDISPAQTSPAWRMGYAKHFESVAFDLNYARSFVPSFGGFGTLSNEEVSSNLHLPVSRRGYVEANASWRSNEALVAGDLPGNLPLRSLWLGAIVGYAAQPWLRIEGFYGRTQQRIDRPGGDLERNRIGVQVVTAKPMRIH